VPGLDLVPLHVPQTSVLEKVKVFVEPFIASIKSISRFIYHVLLDFISYNNVLAFCLLLRPSLRPPLAASSKHFLEFFEYIAEGVALSGSSGSSPLPELIVEPFESGEPLSTPETACAPERTACLLLFIGIHASLIIHLPLSFIS
jgi:hypothetical protein